MAQISENVFIFDDKQQIDLHVDKATIEEIQKAKALADALGYKIVSKVAIKRKVAADKRNKQWFIDRLTDPKDLKEFEKICSARGKGKGFIAAKGWFDKKFPDTK